MCDHSNRVIIRIRVISHASISHAPISPFSTYTVVGAGSWHTISVSTGVFHVMQLSRPKNTSVTEMTHIQLHTVHSWLHEYRFQNYRVDFWNRNTHFCAKKCLTVWWNIYSWKKKGHLLSISVTGRLGRIFVVAENLCWFCTWHRLLLWRLVCLCCYHGIGWITAGVVGYLGYVLSTF